MAEFRSGTYSKSLALSKEDLKNLAKRQQKAKRDEEAKTAKIRPQTYNAPMGSSVSFDAPVKVSAKEEDKEKRKLTDILGPYERMSHVIMSNIPGIVGVESQPSTPLPSKNAGKNFFDRKQQVGKVSAKELYTNNQTSKEKGKRDSHVTSWPDKPTNAPDKPTSAPDAKHSGGTKENSSKHEPSVKLDTKPRTLQASQSARPGAPVSSTPIEKPRRSDIRDSSGISSSGQKSSNSQKVSHKLESSNQNSRRESNQNSKKETTDSTSGKPVNEDRVPVLQSLNKELIGHSKRESNQSASSAPKISPNQQSTLKSAERTSKKPPSEPVAVLKESKEENRNGPNGKFKDKPRLQIPQEKNVEEMLLELTHIPQPLTGIQTPFKDSKFPFQEKLTEPVTIRDLGMPKRSNIISAPVKVESKKMVAEEIQEKDDSDSSDDSGGDSASGDEANDDDNDDDDGSGHSDSSASASGDEGNNDGSSDDEDGAEDKGGAKCDDKEEDKPEKAQPAPVKIPVPDSANTAKASVKATVKAAVKAPPVKQLRPMSSSDSSSSGSESSDSGSDSESVSEVSDTEKPDSPSPEKEKVTPPKMKATPDYMDTTPSPSRQSWNLEAFLPLRNEPSGPLNISKPISLEAPASNKSDPDQLDEVIDVKRSADHVSDENPQSVDQESVSKPMSADEFSPPASTLDKQMLSPIKSPQSVKSPTKRTFNASSVHDKGQSDTGSAKTKTETSVVYSDRYDSIKNRERKKSTSISSPDVIKDPMKQKTSRPGRKQKQRFTPPIVPDDSSSSDSEIEIESSSPRKSLQSVSKDMYKPSSLPSRSSSISAKKKESKRDKLLTGQNSVKLKQADVLYSKQIDCDTSTKPMSNMPHHMHDLEMKKIFNYFSGEKPLSPLGDSENLENVKDVKSDILPVKNLLNGSVKYLNGKPSVLVQIELNLLNKMMFKDKNDPNLFRIKPEISKRLKDNALIGNVKSSNVTSTNPPGTIIANKSHKVLELEAEVSTSLSSSSNHSASNSLASANNSQTSATHSSTVSANSSIGKHFPDSVPKPKVSQKAVLDNVTDIPDFDSLPVREAKTELSESSSSESGSSDSEPEDDSKSSQRELNVSSHPTSFNPSPPDNKKRKIIDTHRVDDSKRRKTTSSKVLNNQSTPDRASQKSNHDLNCEPSHDVVTESGGNSRKSTGKRERHSSTSSQQSTLSQHSTNSTHSKHGRHTAHNQRSQKKAKLSSDPSSDLISSHSAESTQSSTQSQVKSPSTALSTSLTASSSSSKHGKSQASESRKVNGHIPQHPTAVARPEADHRARGNSDFPIHHTLETEEKLLAGSVYHKKATSYKHKADAMPTVPHSLDKYFVFLESVLYFLLSGVAHEREHQSMEASSLFKDTQSLMAHHYHQFRNLDSDSTDKSDVKFTVLCLRIQSLLYMKLYRLKRTESMKLKKALDDHQNKSIKTTSQPKPPSAPSPHQTNWNRSTGTPSPMSPTPSPANSVCSVGSVGSDQTPSKLTNGTSNSAPIAPPGFVLVPQRIHSITQKYFTSTNFLVQAHELWDQSEMAITGDVKDFFLQLDTECGGSLTIHSSLLYLVKYCSKGLTHLRAK